EHAMKSQPIGRRTTVAVVGTVVLLGMLITIVLRTPADAATSPAQTAAVHEAHGGANVPRTDRQGALPGQKPKTWEDHVTWTRLAIVTFADGSAGFDATAARLLQNQTDIGNAIKPYYGPAAGDQLTALLKDHIGIAVQLLQAAKAGNTDAFNDAKTR